LSPPKNQAARASAAMPTDGAGLSVPSIASAFGPATIWNRACSDRRRSGFKKYPISGATCATAAGAKPGDTFSALVRSA